MRKNINKITRESKQIKQRYATRKLKVGMVSLLMGFTFVFSSPSFNQAILLNSKAFAETTNENKMDNNYLESCYLYDQRTLLFGPQDYYHVSQTPNNPGWDENNTKQDVNASVKVSSTEINDKGEQEWTIVFNKLGLYKNGTRTSKPRLGFTLSKNLEITNGGDIEIHAGDEVKHVKSGNGFTRNELNFRSQKLTTLLYNDMNPDTPKGYGYMSTPRSQLMAEGFPGLELQRFLEYYRNNRDNNNLQNINYILNQANSLYFFQLENDQSGKANGIITVKFKTFDKSYQRKGVYNKWLVDKINYYTKGGSISQVERDSDKDSRVTATYFSWDNAVAYSRLDTLSRPLDYTNKDTDRDGLPDYYEEFLGSNPLKPDTDGDKKLDGVEVTKYGSKPETISVDEAAYWDNYPDVYVIDGTNPLVGLPTAPTKVIGKIGEVVEGQTAPYTLVSLRLLDSSKDNSNAPIVGEAISDANGHYKITIGKNVQRNTSARNQFGNYIQLGRGSSDLEQVMNHAWTDVNTGQEGIGYNNETKTIGNGENFSFKVEATSVGFDSNFQYKLPEKSSSVEKVDSFDAKYGAINIDRTLVIDENSLSESEKAAIKEKVVNVIKDGSHEVLIRNLQSADYFTTDINSINVDENVIVDDNGTVTIKIKGNGMNHSISSSDTVIGALKPKFEQVLNKDEDLGIDNNSLVISNIDPKATQIDIRDTTHNEPVLSITKNEDNWISSDPKVASIKVNDGKVYIIPTEDGMDKIESSSESEDRNGKRGIRAVVTLDKSTEPKTIDSDYIEYETNRPVTSAPKLDNINQYAPNIVITDIPKRANKMTIILTKQGEEEKNVDLTLSSKNGKIVWNVGSNFEEVFNSKKTEIDLEDDTLTIRNKNDQLQGWNIQVSATNTKYNGTENNLTKSNIVVYDTKIDTPTYKNEPGYGDTEITVNIPDDASVGDQLTLGVNGDARTYTLTQKQIEAKEITFELQKPLVTGDVVKLGIEDTHGNKAQAKDVVIPEAKDSVAVRDARQTSKDSLEATVEPYEGEANAYLALADGSILKSVKVNIGEPNEDNTRTLHVIIPEGYNGKELKFVFVQKNHKESYSNTVDVDQSIGQIRIKQAQVGANTVKLILPSDAEAGDSYKVEINGIEAATGKLTSEDLVLDGKVKEVSLNKSIPNDAIITTEIVDKLGNMAVYQMPVSEAIDISVLEEAIRIAGPEETVKQTDKYKLTKDETLKNNYDEAIKEAVSLLEKAKDPSTSDDVTQVQLSNAATKLLQAYNSLDGDVDKKPLMNLVTKAEELMQTDAYKYDDENDKEALKSALKEAYNTLVNNNSTQDDLDKSAKDLEEALKLIDGLNKDRLQNLVNQAEEVKETELYKLSDPQKREALDQALEEGKNALDLTANYEDVLQVQSEIDSKADEIERALKDLDGRVNGEGLKAKIKEAKDLIGTDRYKNASDQDRRDLISSITQSEIMIGDLENNDSITQEEVNKQTDDLDEIIKRFNKVTDKKELETAIGKAEALLGKDPEKKGIKVERLKEALEHGKTVNDDKNASQTEVDDATDRINRAMEEFNKNDTPSSGGGGGSCHCPSNNTSNTTPDRHSGKDRYDTAAQIAKEAYPNGAKTVVLVHADKYTDALTAIPYAKTINAPILYVGTDKTPETTLLTLKYLGTKNLVIIGGSSSISDIQKSRLESMGYSITRIGGVDRYDTAQLIAQNIVKQSKLNSKDVIIASGENFPDAISVSSVAIKDETPILLSSRDVLSKYTIKGLESLNRDRVIVVGGENSISHSVENELKPYTKQAITRFAGQNRYETSAIIAKNFRPNATVSIFANGEKFQDAMVSGVLLNKYDAPLLLVRRDSVPNSIVKYMKDSKIKDVIIVGGENSVSKQVENKIKALKK